MDGNAELLALAANQTAALSHVEVLLLAGDLATPAWLAKLDGQARFDLVVCLATLQHLPGFALRRRVVGELAGLLAPEGMLIISAWQFLTSQRLAARQLDWSEIGLTPADVKPGDALLPWRQGGYAIRYVHQIDEAEFERLSRAAGLLIQDTFHADGREGNLNLYAILRRQDRQEKVANHEHA